MAENERRRFITHNSKKIIFLDHSNLKGEAYLKAVNDSIQMASQSSLKNRLILVDLTGSIISNEVLQVLKTLSSASSPSIMKTAVIGAQGMQLFFLKAIATSSNMNIGTFQTQDEALEWLTA